MRALTLVGKWLESQDGQAWNRAEDKRIKTKTAEHTKISDAPTTVRVWDGDRDCAFRAMCRGGDGTGGRGGGNSCLRRHIHAPTHPSLHFPPWIFALTLLKP